MEQGCPTTARLIPDEAGLKLAIPPDLTVLLVPLLPILPAGELSTVLQLSHPLSQVTLALFHPLLLWVHGSRCVLLHQFLVRAGSALLKQGYLSQLLQIFLCTSCVFSKPLGAAVQQQVSLPPAGHLAHVLYPLPPQNPFILPSPCTASPCGAAPVPSAT